MHFGPKEYYHAGIERMADAHRIFRDGRSFALSMYCAGLAVECVLRAFRWSDDPSFEARHDLAALLKASRLLIIDEEYLRRKKKSEEEIQAATRRLRAEMNEVGILWHNNLRFASEASLRAFLRRIGRTRRVKGDPLKKNAGDLVAAAQFVVNRAIVLWKSATNS